MSNFRPGAAPVSSFRAFVTILFRLIAVVRIYNYLKRYANTHLPVSNSGQTEYINDNRYKTVYRRQQPGPIDFGIFVRYFYKWFQNLPSGSISVLGQGVQSSK